MTLMINSVENSTSSTSNKKNSSSGSNETINNNTLLAKTIPTPTTKTNNIVEVGLKAVTSPQPFAEQFDIVLFTPEYINQVAVALSVVFPLEEPLCMGTRTNPINFYTYSVKYAQQCADGKMSFLAIDRTSRMVVGFHLCHEYKTWVEPESADPGVTVQGELLERLHEIYHREQAENTHSGCESQGSPRQSGHSHNTGDNEEKILKICSAGVYSFARRMGLAQRMLAENIKYAKQHGFTKALVECTGAFSQKLYKSIGFKEEARIYYKEYEVEVPVDGKIVKVKPFESIPAPHEFINLSIMDL